jgi:hypothetical protein
VTPADWDLGLDELNSTVRNTTPGFPPDFLP